MSETVTLRLSELYLLLYADAKAYCDYYDLFPGVDADDRALVAFEKGMNFRFHRMRTRVEKIQKIIGDAEKDG
jgi:hypothetical protein